MRMRYLLWNKRGKADEDGDGSKPDYTVAADPEVIPLGSSIVIEGTVYHVEDVGQAIKGKSVDIFFASHEEAKNFGRQKLSVYLK